ncbi:phosphofructokinase domain-containing protein, partial [Baffinella frigidus]
GHCVLVVAEGAGQDHFKDLNLGMDPSGNKRLPDIGVFLKEQAKMWMENHQHNDVEVRYIDPSYQIRSIPATAADSVHCNALGTAIVHGAMAGMTARTPNIP